VSARSDRKIERQLRRLRHRSIQRSIGIVTSVAPLKVAVGGGDTTTAADGTITVVPFELEAYALSSYSPQRGDRVWISRSGADILVHGAIGPALVGGPSTGNPQDGHTQGLEFYPENYGAKGNDFNHDDTAGIQGAIDAAMDYGRGGIVRLDPAKVYVVGANPRRDRNGNCILSLADEIDSTKPISIVGSYDPVGWASPQATLLCARTVDSYSATYGPPSVIGGATEENGGLWRNWSGPVTLKGFKILLLENAPIAGIDGLSFGGFNIDNVNVQAGDGKSAANTNTHPNAFGIRTCGAYGFNHHYLRGGYVLQMHTGYVIPVTDHLWMENPAAYKCKIGLGLQTPWTHGNHAANGLSMSVEHCGVAIAGWTPTDLLTYPAVSGVARIMFQDMRIDIERGDGLEPGADFNEQMTVFDANNVIYGNLKVHRLSGLGVDTSPGVLYGGANLSIEQAIEGPHNIKRWCPPFVGTTTTSSPTANNAYFAEVFVNGTGIVSGVEFRPANTTGQVKAILYNRSGTILAKTTTGVNLAGAATGQQQQVAFSSAYQITPGLYYIGLAFNNGSSSYISFSGTPRGGTVGSSYTTPVNITPPTNFATVPYMHTY